MCSPFEKVAVSKIRDGETLKNAELRRVLDRAHLLFGTLHGLWCSVSADTAPKITANKKKTFILR